MTPMTRSEKRHLAASKRAHIIDMISKTLEEAVIKDGKTVQQGIEIIKHWMDEQLDTRPWERSLYEDAMREFNAKMVQVQREM